MKTIYNVYEGILAGEDVLSVTDSDIVLDNLYKDLFLPNNAEQKLHTIIALKQVVEKYKPKQYNTTNKVKNSDKYFIMFNNSWIGIGVGECSNIVTIIKRHGSNWEYFESEYEVKNSSSSKSYWYHWDGWSAIQANISPLHKDKQLYELPDEILPYIQKVLKRADGEIEL